jgi:hypothetical protein
MTASVAKLFGGSPLKQYFRKYQSSQTHIKGILKSLGSGKDELLMDNAAIDTERANLWNAMGSARADDLSVQGDGHQARGQGQRARPHRSRPRPRHCARPRSSMSASAPRTCSPRWQ